MGFVKSTIDSCLYVRDSLIFVFYVDDGIIISLDDDIILHFIAELRECKFDLGIEADYAGYLGVDLIKLPDGTMLMSQTGLIERIIADFGLSDSASSKPTPAAEVLGPFKSSPPFEEVFNYRSVLGKILYVSSNTRCEITLANHQCARFSIDPWSPHGVALKRIGRYLLGTRDKGMIIKPTKDLTLDCYADADFAGLFSTSDPDDPKSVKSRSGFVITLGRIPVSWGSKLYLSLSSSSCSSPPPHNSGRGIQPPPSQA
jgi:Reverse transcriptase (RNA-dependent DNA polymerase)